MCHDNEDVKLILNEPTRKNKTREECGAKQLSINWIDTIKLFFLVSNAVYTIIGDGSFWHGGVQ